MIEKVHFFSNRMEYKRKSDLRLAGSYREEIRAISESFKRLETIFSQQESRQLPPIGIVNPEADYANYELLREVENMTIKETVNDIACFMAKWIHNCGGDMEIKRKDGVKQVLKIISESEQEDS